MRWAIGAAAVGAVAIACAVVPLGDSAEHGDITYSEDVQSILQRRCISCHGGQGFGGTNLAVSYGDVLVASSLCPELPVYRCILELVTTGQMPPNVGCTGDPGGDTGNDACLTQTELDLVRIWVNSGGPE